MATYLINHLRIPNEVPNDGGLEYLEQVEATFRIVSTFLNELQKVLEQRSLACRFCRSVSAENFSASTVK